MPWPSDFFLGGITVELFFSFFFELNGPDASCHFTVVEPVAQRGEETCPELPTR